MGAGVGVFTQVGIDRFGVPRIVGSAVEAVGGLFGGGRTGGAIGGALGGAIGGIGGGIVGGGASGGISGAMNALNARIFPMGGLARRVIADGAFGFTKGALSGGAGAAVGVGFGLLLDAADDFFCGK